MEPKFNVGDHAWSYVMGEMFAYPIKLRILGVNIYNGVGYQEISYKTNEPYAVLTSETFLFSTKKDAQLFCNKINKSE